MVCRILASEVTCGRASVFVASPPGNPEITEGLASREFSTDQGDEI